MKNLFKEFLLSGTIVYLIVLVILIIEKEKDLLIYLNTFIVCLVASIIGFIIFLILKIYK